MATWSTPTWATGNALNQANFNTKVANNLTYLHDLLTDDPLILTTSGKVGVNITPEATLHLQATGSGNTAIRLSDSEEPGEYLNIAKFDTTVQYRFTHDDGNAHHAWEASPESSSGNAIMRFYRNSTINGNSGLEINAADGTTQVDYWFPTSSDGDDVIIAGHGGVNIAFGRTTASANFHFDSGSGDAQLRLHRAGNTNQYLQINRNATGTDYRSFTAADAYLQFNGILSGNNNSDKVYYEFGNDSDIHASGNQAFRLYDGHASSPSVDTQISMHTSNSTVFHSTNTGVKVGWWVTEPEMAWHMAGGKRALYTLDTALNTPDANFALTMQFQVNASGNLVCRYYRANGDYATETIATPSGGWTTP